MLRKAMVPKTGHGGLFSILIDFTKIFQIFARLMRNSCICYTTSTLSAKWILDDKEQGSFFKNQAFLKATYHMGECTCK